MGKRLESITIYGTLIGTIWQGIEYTKEVSIKFTPDERPFTRKWTGLRDALQHITNDGDFVSCTLSEGEMSIQWADDKYFTWRGVEIPNCKLTADFLEKKEDYKTPTYSDWRKMINRPVRD